jgi:hypothetical protein
MDTGVCALGTDLTILVGKNESGKTATLEALKYFDKAAVTAPDDAFPLDGSDREPSVEMWFRLTQDEISGLQQNSGVKLSEKALNGLERDGIGLVKNSRGRYWLSDECVERLFQEESGNTYQEQIKHIKSAKERLQELLNGPRIPAIDFTSTHENIQEKSKELIRVVKSFLPSIKDEQQQVEAVEAVRTIIRESKKLTEPQQAAEGNPQGFHKDAAAFLVEAVVQGLPHFIFFSEFSDILPFEIPISHLKENQAVLDFAKVAGLDLDQLTEAQDLQKRINYLSRFSATVSGDFQDYWGQDKVELIVKPEGDQLLFGVKESGRTDFFKIGQRSKGFQWFLSFYLRLNAQKTDNSVILIDEPGVHLHAKAQREILKILESKIVTESQVIFSTHCPYLIDPRRLDRVRLVIKDQRGTVLTEDIHGQTDEEHTIPIMTAVGSEKRNMAFQAEKRNVIVGSAADFYLCKALTAYVKDLDLEEIHFVPATDAENMVQLVSLMVGYGLEFQVLLNNNAEGYQLRKQLKERFGLENENIIYVSKKPDYATEDLFAPEDFHAHILKGQPENDQAVLNSEYLKAHTVNRVLLAKKFFDRTQKGIDQVLLSPATIASFRRLFEKILNAFNGIREEEAAEKVPEPPKAPDLKPKRRSLFDFLTKTK